MAETQLAFLGAGNMAEAIARGLLRAGLLAPEAMIACDLDAQRRRLFAEDLGIAATADAAEAVAQAPTVLLAVKPQQAAEALDCGGGGTNGTGSDA